MNDYIRKNNCINKDDIQNATNNVISILEKKKKVIIAHDRGKRKDAILGKTISYILASSKKAGVKKPVVLYINLMKEDDRRSKNVIYAGKPGSIYNQNDLDIKNLKEGDEIVSIILDSFDMMVGDILVSTDFLHYIDNLRQKYNLMYEVIASSNLFSEPIILPFLMFRLIDNKFAKLVGIEGARDLSELFYDKNGITKPRLDGFTIHKKIAEYIDVDLYNYVNEKKFITPMVIKNKTAEGEVISTLDKIKQLDEEDGSMINSNKKRFHIILCNDVTTFFERYRSLIIYYAKNKHKNIGRVVSCRDISMFCKWNITDEYREKDKKKQTVIFVVGRRRYQLGPWFAAKDLIKSISFLSTTDNKDNFPMSLEDLMNAYSIVYSSNDASDKNKIFIQTRGDYISYDNYIEMEYLLTRFLPYKFNMDILLAFYNNYMKLGTTQRKAKITVAKKTA